MDETALMEGIPIGAVAGALATILVAPRSGQETRAGIKAHLDEIRDKIAQQLGDTGKLTKRKYEQVVKAVIAEYEATKRISLEEAKEIRARLRDGYEAVKATARRHAGGGKQPAVAGQEPVTADTVLERCDRPPPPEHEVNT
jgi:gas vesicle protein